MQIINASYYEQILPNTWKKTNVSPLPKKKTVDTLEKDLRPIFYVKPASLNLIDRSQYGAIPNSSTTKALISMLHHWCVNTDGNGSTIRTILFDYRKAFDFIDQHPC